MLEGNLEIQMAWYTDSTAFVLIQISWYTVLHARLNINVNPPYSRVMDPELTRAGVGRTKNHDSR